ncbi:methyltransferase, FkbM family [Loktanella sp. DSM 29012]|uniref:FkbM family methyltransferase n=1 Tax=Loktanella gaetbuli TaxID=2881335 RepID=A0ABS8BVF6_9RHOB|nr:MULTISPECIES: FkbM family methyltransferase [Loktanella]MCB5199693.1 FkbM family methyltransferase [Loktanella gaetbuli]SEQ00176.1 methyltransferase, FkbM family [Loktanella sp. DSM 29012]
MASDNAPKTDAEATAQKPGTLPSKSRYKSGNPFEMPQRHDANHLLKLFKNRRDTIRKEKLDPETATFDDGLEDYVCTDADKPGKTLQRFRDFALPYTAIYQGQVMQDLWCLFELDGKREGYFVDFGATNGTTMSNSMILERNFDWKGIVAEPNPIFHENLARARECHISHKCVHSSTGDTMEFLMAARPMFSRLADASDGLEFEEGGVEERIKVETITLNDLLDEYDAPDVIDFISIDTEGSEMDIMEKFDFGPRHVRLFAIEHNHEERRDHILELMTSKGYVRRLPELSKFDDWYIHESDIRD